MNDPRQEDRAAGPELRDSEALLGAVNAKLALEIEQREEIERSLRQAQSRYQIATSAARVGVWDWNIETNEFYLDPNVKAILGYSDEEIANDIEKWVDYVHPDDREPVMAAANAHLEGETAEYVYEHRMLHKDGSVRWIMVRGLAHRDDAGKPVRMVGTDTDITERKLAEEALRAERARTDALKKRYIERVISAQDEERRRIARELHDQTGQSITSLLVGLRSLSERPLDGATRREIEELLQVAESLVDDIGRLSLGLHPSLLDDIGLEAAIRRLAEEFTRRYGPEVRVELNNGARLPKDLRTALYRIVQEALTNVAKHAAAEVVSVTLARTEDGIQLVVEDDGSGFDLDAVAAARDAGESGFGLVGIRERAALFEGAVEIESRRGSGTTLFVQLPAREV